MNIKTSDSKLQPPPVTGSQRYLLRPLPEPDHFLFIVDNSAAERFICPTLARNYLVWSREPHPTNAALIFGGALHVGIETLLKEPKKKFAFADSDDGPLEDETELLIRAATDLTLFFTKHPSPMDEYRTLATALEVLKHYQQRIKFPDYHMVIQQDERGLIVERAFELPLGVLEFKTWVKDIGPHIEVNEFAEGVTETEAGIFIDTIHVAWAGRIDVIGHCNRRNRVIDHKTSSQASGNKRVDFVNDFLLSSQTRGYVWAAKQLWPELEISGACVDAIQLKKPAAGSGLMDRGPRGGEPALDFFRAYYDYSDQAIASWEENTMQRIEQFLTCVMQGQYPMEATYCYNRKYGKCPYHDCCVIEIEEPEAAKRLLFSEAYRPVTWNPTDNR